MKKILSMILLGCVMTSPLTSCMGDEDDPNTDGFIVTSPVSVGTVNSTIGEVKDKYCANSNEAEFSFGSANFYTKIKEDVVFEGVVVANDEGGNLYQTLMLRSISFEGNDESIVLSVKNPFLSPFFSLGQRIRVNLKGLYVGCYGYMPKIGQPYKTSKGNFRLGPMLMQLCETNIQLIGRPNLDAPELKPVDLTVEGIKVSKSYKNVPMLATLKGTIDDVQGFNKDVPAVGKKSGKPEPLPKIFAPEVLYDDGFAVNRDMTLDASGAAVILRTSTQNPIAFLPIPEDSRSYTGILSYYGKDWQFQLRSVKDINPEVK